MNPIAQRYVQWATRNEPYSFGLEAAIFVAAVLLLWFVIGVSVFLWIILVPVLAVFAAWVRLLATRRRLRVH